MKILYSLIILMLMNGVKAEGANNLHDNKELTIRIGRPTVKQVLHYRKMYEKKPFPDAELYYYDNGVYKIISQGENHYGVYTMQGDFDDETFTVRFISLPSIDWGNKTAFHQLTFVRGDGKKCFHPKCDHRHWRSYFSTERNLYTRKKSCGRSFIC